MIKQQPQRVLQRFWRRFHNRLKAEKAPKTFGHRPEFYVTLPSTHQEAVKRLAEKQPWGNKVRDRMVVDAKQLHPDMERFAKRMVKECNVRGIPLWVFETYRSPERQQALYDQGRTKPGKIVTRAKPGSSAHQFGCAVDLIHGTRAWDLHPKEWAVLIAIGQEVARKLNIKVENGFVEWGWDAPHWQLKDWKIYRQAETELAHEIAWPQGREMRFCILDERVKRIKERKASPVGAAI